MLTPLVLAMFLAIFSFLLGLLQRRGAGPSRPSPVVIPRRRHSDGCSTCGGYGYTQAMSMSWTEAQFNEFACPSCGDQS